MTINSLTIFTIFQGRFKGAEGFFPAEYVDVRNLQVKKFIILSLYIFNLIFVTKIIS